MANLVKSFINHNGLDLKSSDIVRDPKYSSGMLNAQYKKNGDIGKREGKRVSASSFGGSGLFNYRRINTENQQVEDILISVSDEVFRLYQSQITIAYTGASLSSVLELFFDPDAGEYKCQITEDTTLILDQGLGIGYDEASIFTLADLKTAIDALTDYTMTIVGDTTVPAAFIDLIRVHNLSNGDSEVEASYGVEVNSVSANPLPGNVTYQADENFENTTFVQLNNVLYMSNGYDDMLKYDGQNLYRAGLPTPSTAPITVLGGAGSLTSPTGYRHSIVYSQIDAVGNEVTSNRSSESVALTPAGQSIDVTYNNILLGSGFNTNAGIVNGAQAGVNTITVDDGGAGAHTLKIGDTAYFFDGVTGEYVTREVTGITGSSITIDGAAVDVADNDVISANLRVQIYRNQDGGNFVYLVEEVPNNPFQATSTYNDDIADSALGIQYIDPISPHDPPPKGRYIASYNNQMFLGGRLDLPNSVAWSAPESPEYWSPSLFSITTQSPNGDSVTGLKQSNEVMAIFEERAIHIISGDIANNNIRVDTITKDIGCVSHHTIQEVRGSLYFLSDRGVWSTTSGQLPVERSWLIEPKFDRQTTIPDEQKRILKRSVAVNFRDKEQYILFIPAEDTLGLERYANEFSTIYVEDYFRSAWLEWGGFNMSGGAVVHNNRLYFVENDNSAFSGAVRRNLFYQMDRGDNWDFNDNENPVEATYATAWYNFDNPSIFKKFLRFKIFATEETDNNAFMLDIDIEKDFIADNVIGTFEIDFSSGADGYGISSYGTAPYGDVFESNRKYKIGPIKAKSLRFVMKNNSPQENIDVTGWEVEVATPYRQELKE